MATRQSPDQKRTVERVMHEFKHGELEKRDGRPVRNPKQAIAIALHEAGASNRESPKDNAEVRARTRRRETSGRTARSAREGGGDTKAGLYAEAKRRNIPGRSRMTKAELARALHA